MSAPLHVVSQDRCKGDGICVDVCPEDVLDLVDGKAATVDERVETCIHCGQCVAVCPNDSIHMPEFAEGHFEALPRVTVAYDELLDLLKHRRSIRAFKDQPVERELILKILEAAATAPMGIPPHSTEVVVVDGRAERDVLLKELVNGYAFMVKAFSSPIGRLMVRVMAGADGYRTLKSFIIDVVRYANDAYDRDGTDRYMHGAPVVLLFHGNRQALSYEENAHLVCHHAMMAAVSLGLGTTIIGLIPPIVDRSKTLRARYGIPSENRVLSALIVGHPKYRYRKSIRRGLANIRTA